MNDTQKLVEAMLKENTGIGMLDSGGESNRQWQRNQKVDFTKVPEVMLDYTAPCKSSDVVIEVSLYHYLPTVLELDAICNEYNALPCPDWDGEAYGVSEEQEAWLKSRGFEYGDSWNTYDGESNLSQVLQGTELKFGGSTGVYILLQVHGGCDVRGGYTDAKMFKLQRFQEGINPCPSVFVVLTKKDGTKIDLGTDYDGVTLRGTEDNEDYDIEEGDTLKAFPMWD